MTQELDLKELRKVAEAATPGTWVLDGFAEGGCSEGCCEEYTRLSVYSVTNQGEVVASEVRAQRNADYFDAFDPPTVLALLTQLEQAEAQVARVRTALTEVQGRGERISTMNNSGSIRSQERAARGNGYLEATRLAFCALDGGPNE